MFREEYLKGFIKGWREALATVGVDLRKEEIEGYSLKNFGEYYLRVVKEMGDCMDCEHVGSKLGCAIGETTWCTRMNEK